MKTAGLVLAGGQGERMGGIQKGLQLLDGKPLVQHVVERLAPQVDGLWICANRHLSEYQAFHHPVFSDLPSFCGLGPLAGIASFAAHLPPEYSHIQICPCDTPFLPVDLCGRLQLEIIGGHDQFGPHAHEVSPVQHAYPQTEFSHQYSCAMVTRQALNAAHQSIAAGQYSLRSWLTQCDAVSVIGFADADFMNINTLAQLSVAQHG